MVIYDGGSPEDLKRYESQRPMMVALALEDIATGSEFSANSLAPGSSDEQQYRRSQLAADLFVMYKSGEYLVHHGNPCFIDLREQGETMGENKYVLRHSRFSAA